MDSFSRLSSHGWLFYLVILGVPALLIILLCFSFLKKPFIRSLKKKHVFITGGSSGIGLAVARRALKEGAYVTLISRSMSNLAFAVESLLNDVPTATNECIRCEAADVADYAALSGAIERAFSWKPIDVFVCNAGLTRGGYLGEGQFRDIEITLKTNFVGSVNALHAALPLLKHHSHTQPISIVITASLASLFFMYGHAVYTATKYAMRGLAEGLRFELLPYNIKVSLLCPGFTTTRFLDDADKEEEICDVLKWVNLYSRRWAESADGVAARAIAAAKSGTFLVTTNPLGLVLGTLGRGFIPSQSLFGVTFELLFFIPFRIASMLITPIFFMIVRHKGRARRFHDKDVGAVRATENGHPTISTS